MQHHVTVCCTVLHVQCVRTFCDHTDQTLQHIFYRFLAMFTLKFIIILTVVVPLNYKVCFSGCSRAEYMIDKQCCPMCTAGNYVLWHCTHDAITTCAPCPEFTFIDESNGLTRCFPCNVCDSEQGLEVNKACTRSSNTVCGPLEGFYCINKTKGSCTLAVKHSKCSPGKYIKKAGETYSNGSFSSCLTHTKCEALGLTEIKPGTHSSDAECGNSTAVSTIITIFVIATVMLFASLIIFVCIWKKKTSFDSGIQEAGIHLDEKEILKDFGGRENVKPYSLAGNKVKNPHLEMITISSLRISDIDLGDTGKPKHVVYETNSI